MGPWSWGAVTCWVTAAAKPTPPVSAVTGGRAGGRAVGTTSAPCRRPPDGWAPVLGPASTRPPGTASPEAARARGLFLCSLDGGRAASNRAEAPQPGCPLRSGGGARPWPCSHVCGPGCGSGWVPAGLASSGGGWQLQSLRPGLGGVGIGWRTLSSQYGEGGRGHRPGSGGLWLEKHGQSRVRGALGLGWPPSPPSGLRGGGPVRSAGGGGPGGCCWWRGGSEEGPGPSVSSVAPDQGFCFSLGGRGRGIPALCVCQSGHMGGCWPSPHLGPGSALRFRGAVEWG